MSRTVPLLLIGLLALPMPASIAGTRAPGDLISIGDESKYPVTTTSPDPNNKTEDGKVVIDLGDGDTYPIRGEVEDKAPLDGKRPVRVTITITPDIPVSDDIVTQADVVQNEDGDYVFDTGQVPMEAIGGGNMTIQPIGQDNKPLGTPTTFPVFVGR